MLAEKESLKAAIRKFISFVLGVALAGGVAWGSYKIATIAFQTFASLDTNVAVAILAGSATVLASTVTVVISRHYQVRREQEIAHRDKKIELYDSFLKKLFEIFLHHDQKASKPENLVPFLRELQRKIMLWSGPKAIRAYAEWHREISKQPPRAIQMIKMMDLFLALREDLGHSNKGVDYSHMVRFMLRNSDLFIQEYRKNPNVTFEEIVKLEEKLGLTSEFKDQPTIRST